MAVQDGMTPADVPKECAVVFVGGTTSWKWRSLPMWASSFSRVHVGRVNSIRLLLMAENAGAESCDGTGWFRDPRRTKELESYLSHDHNHPDLWQDQKNAPNVAVQNSMDPSAIIGEYAA
jgi:hypothetical protein